MSHKIIRHIFGAAKSQGASKISIQEQGGRLDCFYHFADGTEQSFSLPKKLSVELTEKLRQTLKIAPDEIKVKKYCRLYDKSGDLSFYLSIMPGKQGEKIIISIPKKKTIKFSLGQLGLSSDDSARLSKFTNVGRGLLLISSPAGNGKSTTLYSLLREINRQVKNAYLFDRAPLENIDGLNIISRVTQSSWESVLRHDSDVIAFRRPEGIEDWKNILRAANGRLAIATIEADNALEALEKILNLPLPLALKIHNLRMISGQHLLPLKRNTGGRGHKREMIGVFEIISCGPEIKQIISEAARQSDKRDMWKKIAVLAMRNGWRPLKTEVDDKRKRGLIKAKV